MDYYLHRITVDYLRPQLESLSKQLAGIGANKDIECIHRARVAGRRLRVGLRIGADCFGGRQLDRWRRQLRRFGRGLGQARDRDVQLAFLQEMLGELAEREYRPGVARLHLRLSQQRQILQPKVIRRVQRLLDSRVLDEMFAEVRRLTFWLDQQRPDPAGSPVFALARAHLQRRLAAFLKHADSTEHPDQIERHHKLRIAAKRFRYGVEVFQPAFDGRLDPYAKMLKKLQSLLGGLHDCDVWQEFVPVFQDEESRRTEAYFGHDRNFGRLRIGLDYLLAERQSRREELFGELAQTCREVRAASYWEPFERLLAAQADAAARSSSDSSVTAGDSDTADASDLAEEPSGRIEGATPPSEPADPPAEE